MKRIFLSAIVAMSFFAASQVNAQTIKQTGVTPIANGINTLEKITPITFSYEKSWAEKLKLKPTAHSGFDVEQLKSTAPELVINQQLNYTEGKNNTKTAVVPKADNDAIIALLVASVKEQQQEIEALKKQINQLKDNAK